MIYLKKILPLLVIFGATIIFFWPNITWPAVNITPSVGTNDFTDLNYPFRHFLLESLEKGQLPLWASKVSGGYPLFAEGIGGLYPLYLISGFLPLPVSVNFTIVTTYLLLGLFSYLLLREFGLSRLSATFGAVNLSLSGFAINQLMHWEILTSFTFFVAQLFFLEKLIKTNKFSYLFLASLMLGLQVLGGHPQMNLYSMIFLGIYFFIKHSLFGQRKLFQTITLYIIFALLGIGIAAVQLIPTLEFTLSSTRSAGLSTQAITRYNFSLKDIITFILPYAKFDPSHTSEALIANGWPTDEKYGYVGIFCLALALLAVFKLFKKDGRVVILTVILVFSFLLSLGGETFLGFVLLLPPFNFFRLPLRFLMFVDFSLVMLAAFGLEELLKATARGKEKGRLSTIAGVVLIILSFANIYYYGQKLHPPVSADKWYKQPEVAKFLRENLKPGERVINEHYYYPTYRIFMGKPELWDNPQIFINLRNLIPVFNNLLDNIDMTSGVANSGGLKIGRYNDLELYLVFSGLKYPTPEKPEISDGYIFINRLLGTRYVLLTEEVKNPLLRLVYKTDFDNGQDQVFVYEFTDYFPRAFMVPKAEMALPADIKKHLIDGDFSIKDKIFLEEKTDWGARGGYAGTVEIKNYQDQAVSLETLASGDGFLFLSDNYYPGWKAYLDGKETKIYRADYAFRAVQVPEGSHKVIFKYEPESFKYGGIISLFSLSVVALGFAWFGFKKVNHKKNQDSNNR